jgi:hypothetical protein
MAEQFTNSDRNGGRDQDDVSSKKHSLLWFILGVLGSEQVIKIQRMLTEPVY